LNKIKENNSPAYYNLTSNTGELINNKINIYTLNVKLTNTNHNFFQRITTSNKIKMALEIEHKFLIKNNDWKEHIRNSATYKQGYLVSDKTRSIRIRTSNNTAWLNIKSATTGSYRNEYEYEIPFSEGIEILNTLCETPLIEKIRHFVPYKQHIWEIDVFDGENEGLVIAEVELSEIGEAFSIPTWVGIEVTDDLRYYNNSLCKNPYKNWN
jgi:adenylate cyclase